MGLGGWSNWEVNLKGIFGGGGFGDGGNKEGRGSGFGCGDGI